MADEGGELRRIAWPQVFPFTRLFATFQRARDFKNLIFALGAVLAAYATGRMLDAAWTRADGGVARVPSGAMRTELDAFTGLAAVDADRWQRQALRAWRDFSAQRGQFEDEAQRAQLAKARELVETRLSAGLRAVGADSKRTPDTRSEARRELELAADLLRLQLAGRDVLRMADDAFRARAVEQLITADDSITKAQSAEEIGLLTRVIAQRRQLSEGESRAPRGPFISMLHFQSRCFAAAVRGVCSGNLGFGGGVHDAQPAMLGSIASAGGGLLWLVTQRPWFALLYGGLLLLIFAYFGAAICRNTAVRAARDEPQPFSSVSQFVRERYAGNVLAVGIPLATFVGVAALLILGGILGAIPGIGPVLSGAGFGLALLGGLALMAVFAGLLLGFHLLWPTIMVEGSDAFDAIQRAFGYVFQRGWSLAFYSFVLLVYGALGFVAVRALAMLLLKLTHSATSVGMGVFGVVESARTDTFPQLTAMWHMPAWSDLTLLPNVNGPAFWGSFNNAPLSGAETVGMWLIAAWVFLVVALVGAFVVSFYYAGATEMYLLLRREVDGVEFDEIFYEEYEEPLGGEPAAATASGAGATAPEIKGTALPVVSPPKTGA